MNVGFPSLWPPGDAQAGPVYEGPRVGRLGNEATWRMPDAEHPWKNNGFIVDGRARPESPGTVGLMFGDVNSPNAARVRFDPRRTTPEQRQAASDAAVREVLGRVVPGKDIPKEAAPAVAWAYAKHLEAEMAKPIRQAYPGAPDGPDPMAAHLQPAYLQAAYPSPAYPQASYPPPAYPQAAYPPPAYPQVAPAGPFGNPPRPTYGVQAQAQAPALPWPPQAAKVAAVPPAAPLASRRVRFWVPTGGRPVEIPARYHGIDVQRGADGAPLAIYLQWDLRDPDEPYPLDNIEGPFAIETDAEPGVYHPVENTALTCRCGDYAISVLLATPAAV